ncbi:AraC family transcriptional regulator [Fulvivirga sp. M361]|uniref:helix-turn-helix domain-containing protein n=1 Tax=Fulvivirga sp. M361 TaxID=2594266 RepID=UPI00117B5714|nr:helix-turn-helix domain-containing protein [Fulvivirga sp. M361]TRX50645.1 AraC family transcriptional regulator [Fulvivirga sp. M361]
MNNEEIYFNLHPVNFLIISGTLQVYVIAGILFFKRTDQSLSNKLLAATVLVVNLHITYLMLLDLNLDNMYPFLLWVPYSGLTAIGPFIFLYTKSLTTENFTISKKEWILFIPFTIELILQVFQITYSILNNSLYYNAPSDLIITAAIYAFATGSIFHYLRLSLQKINEHEKWALKNFSDLKEVTLAWLHRLITYYRIFWIFWIPFVAIFLLIFRFQLQYFALILIIYLLLLIITYLTYWIGIEGISRMNLVFLRQKTVPVESKSYANLSTQKIKLYIQKFESLMKDEELFLNESLNLREFSNQAEADPNLVSYILNTHLGKNFYEFINFYRIEEVKKKLNDPKYKHLTILALALQSGFNSKTSFNRIFKQTTGLTPSQFQKKVSDK